MNAESNRKDYAGAEVHRKLAPEGGTVQMLARLGYADAVPASPRWPLKVKIIKE